MNRVVRGSSLLIVTAIVAACAAQRDEGKADADRQGPQPQQPATEEADASLAKAEAHDRAIQEVVVTGAEASRVRQDSAAACQSPRSAAAGDGGQLLLPAARVPAADEHRALPAHGRQPRASGRRATGLDVLDRRRHGRVRQRAALPQRRPAAAAGRGARRGDDQLLRLSTMRRRRAATCRSAWPRKWRRRRGIRRRCS